MQLQGGATEAVSAVELLETKLNSLSVSQVSLII